MACFTFNSYVLVMCYDPRCSIFMSKSVSHSLLFCGIDMDVYGMFYSQWLC